MVGKKSFTLVEISIVMCVVAMLIGSLIGGRKLVERAKVQATIAEVQEYQSAFAKFYETYGYMPGDMPDAQAKLAPEAYKNVSAATLRTVDDKVLKTIPLNGVGKGYLFNCVFYKDASSGETKYYSQGSPAAPYFSDSILTWSHLSAAGLIEEKYASLCRDRTSLDASKCLVSGYNIPKVKYGTGVNPVYLFRSLPKENYSSTCGGNEYTYGSLVAQKVYQHVVLEMFDFSHQRFESFNDSLYCKDSSGNGRRWQASNGGITAQMLAEIDIKIDDGLPLTGNVAGQNPSVKNTLDVNTAHPCVKIATANYQCEANKIRGQLKADILSNPASLAAINMYNATDKQALCIGVFAMPQF